MNYDSMKCIINFEIRNNQIKMYYFALKANTYYLILQVTKLRQIIIFT